MEDHRLSWFKCGDDIEMISYYLGYCILKSWKKEQGNTQDLIRKTAYCIFATQIVMLVLGILLRIAAGNSLLDGGLIELDWILTGLFLLCIPQIKTKEKIGRASCRERV